MVFFFFFFFVRRTCAVRNSPSLPLFTRAALITFPRPRFPTRVTRTSPPYATYRWVVGPGWAAARRASRVQLPAPPSPRGLRINNKNISNHHHHHHHHIPGVKKGEKKKTKPSGSAQPVGPMHYNHISTRSGVKKKGEKGEKN
ncbi:hypothetical protein T492DRAFT_292867 [Pavlovales sp. CCMP2436]|nr:hypothetical protein T492DRAFT_292867 [Pavlovales sp. CCMP2436]